jgi:hypothetical protein
MTRITAKIAAVIAMATFSIGGLAGVAQAQTSVAGAASHAVHTACGNGNLDSAGGLCLAP